MVGKAKFSCSLKTIRVYSGKFVIILYGVMQKETKEGNFGISCGIPWLHILSTILHLKLNDPWKIKHVGSGPWKPPLALVTKQYMATDFRQLKLL